MKIVNQLLIRTQLGVLVPFLIGGLLSAAFTDATARDESALSNINIPTFQEQAAVAGIDHQYTGDWEYFVGGGGAAFDCNGDRLPDVFLAGGESPAQLFKNISTPSGVLNFESIPTGLSSIEKTGVVGAYAVHLDKDSNIDLVVLRVGQNLLMRGDGNCGFTPANNDYEFDGGRAWTTGFSATWEKGAKFPTLAFGNYIDQSAPGSPWGTCHDNVLVRPFLCCLQTGITAALRH